MAFLIRTLGVLLLSLSLAACTEYTTIENDKILLALQTDRNGKVENLVIRGGEREFFTLGPDLGLCLGDLNAIWEKRTGIAFRFTGKYSDPARSWMEFTSEDPHFDVKLELGLEKQDSQVLTTNLVAFHADIKVRERVTANFLRFDFHYPFDEPLDFVRVPHLRPDPFYIMGDHKLGTPAIMLAKEGSTVALMTDLETIPVNRDYKMHMDMDHQDSGRISLGFRDYHSFGHVFFQSTPWDKITFDPEAQEDLELDFFLRIETNESKEVLLREVTQFLWKYHGRDEMKNILPQTLPFEQFSRYSSDRLTDPNLYSVYREFEYQGEPCAGFIYRTGTGRSKGRYDTPEPEDLEHMITNPVYDHWLIKLAFRWLMNDPKIIDLIGIVMNNIVIPENYVYFWNQAWFNNVRTAFGLCGVGQLTGNPEYCEMAEKTVNLAIQAPMEGGFFPSMAVLTSQGIRWIEGVMAFSPQHEYNTVDMALTGYWMIQYANRFEYRRQDVLDKLSTVANALIDIQLTSGAVPTTVRVEGSEGTGLLITPVEDLLYESPGSSATGMLLCELYKITKEAKYLEAAERIAEFLAREIIPYHQWYDYETFFSGTAYAELYPDRDFEDPHTLSLPQNTMSIYWTTSFLKDLYECTGEAKHLESGLYVLDYLTTFQQLFNASFLSFNGFGGFCSQNTDAEWTDARQGLFARELMEYYFTTGEESYLERAIAALKQCYVLVLHEKNLEVAPGIFRWITEEDYGAQSENYAHQGFDHPVQAVVTPDWGWGTSMMALTVFHDRLGDLFIDLESRKAYGVNACSVQTYNVADGTLSIDLDILPEKSELALIIAAPENPGSAIERICVRNLRTDRTYEITLSGGNEAISLPL